VVRYRRNFVPGGTYFFTITLADRRSEALVDHIGALRSAFRAARRERPFSIDAIAVLPDHLHAILTLPPNDTDFPGRWRRIKGHFSIALIQTGLDLKRLRNGDLALWQRRFWEHTIGDDRDFARHVDYIHFNPVKHGLVQRVRDWPDSSFHRYVREACCRMIGQATPAREKEILASNRCSPHERSDIWDGGKRAPDIAALIRATSRERQHPIRAASSPKSLATTSQSPFASKSYFCKGPYSVGRATKAVFNPSFWAAFRS
jgi:putative transposase